MSVVTYNKITPDMDVVETLANHAIQTAEKFGLSNDSEPDADNTQIGSFGYAGGSLFADKAGKPSVKPSGPAPSL